jgi:hypothetical protein
MLERFRLLSGKIILLTLLPVLLFLLLLAGYVRPRLRESVMASRKSGVRNLVDLTMGILDNQEVEVKAGRRKLEFA